MKYDVRKISVSIISYFMIGIIALLITNQSLFLHTHNLADGTAVVHAHPFNKSDSSSGETHNHSKKEIISLQHLQLLFAITFIIFSIIKYNDKKINKSRLALSYKYTYTTHYQGRAPPKF